MYRLKSWATLRNVESHSDYKTMSSKYSYKQNVVCILKMQNTIAIMFLLFRKVIKEHVLAATKQLFEWLSPSVCPSVCLWHIFHSVPKIMTFSEIITNDISYVHAKGQGQRSKVKVTEFTTQLNRFRTVTPIWIHKWWWNDA